MMEGVRVKNLKATALFVDISIHREKMEQILLAYGLPKETVTAIMIYIYKNKILRTLRDLIKENDFTLKKARSKQNHAETITESDYTDCQALHANTPAQAESLLQIQEQEAGNISLHMNANKTYMCFQWGVILTLSG